MYDPVPTRFFRHTFASIVIGRSKFPVRKFLTRLALLPPTVMVCGALSLSATASAFELAPCRIDAGSAFDTAKAQCGIFEIAENPDDPDGTKIGLHVAVVPSLNVEPLNDPLVLLAGGPGQSAIDSYLMMGGAFELVRRDRPILLVDQRGTGRSNPLTCPELEFEDMSADIDLDEARRQTGRCLDELAGDPRFYTTSVAVDDLDAVRAALGYEQLNLWGGSYGSRVALHYLKTYPQHTRSAIIDGVVPADLLLGPAIALDAQVSLDTLFDRCDEDGACSEAFGDLRASFAALRVSVAPMLCKGNARTIRIKLSQFPPRIRGTPHAPRR